MADRDLSNYTVLVVDDEKNLCDLLAEEFEDMGMRTLTAYGGREAYEIIQSEKVDVVVSDIKMPDGDGVELLDKIRALDCRVPFVIMMTGYADLTEEDLQAKGAARLYAKPVYIEKIVEDIYRLADQLESDSVA